MYRPRDLYTIENVSWTDNDAQVYGRAVFRVFRVKTSNHVHARGRACQKSIYLRTANGRMALRRRCRERQTYGGTCLNIETTVVELHERVFARIIRLAHSTRTHTENTVTVN